MIAYCGWKVICELKLKKKNMKTGKGREMGLFIRGIPDRSLSVPRMSHLERQSVPMGTLREHSRNTPGTLREHSGNTPGTLKEHSGNTPATLQEHSGNTQGTVQEHSRNTQGTLTEHWGTIVLLGFNPHIPYPRTLILQCVLHFICFNLE